MTYPVNPGFTKGSATSEAAAFRVRDKARTQKAVIETLIHTAKYHGTTADALRLQMKDQWPNIQNNIVSARISALVADGKVIKTERDRMATTGSPHTVYVHKEFSDMDRAVVTPSVKKTRADEFMKKTEASFAAMLDILNRGDQKVVVSPNLAIHNALKEYFK